ncbi:hypothetical protein E2L08_08065 [Palleronia sediminis]|uniref:Uncharacterized protein n=1 Tax=Palleronia sediminis TaxID=2547833 RepID=A0A4R6AAQ4_9RHOB|nr:hypothetical protein [Palleronia sediminis]TDL79834.1 hypothetical protein E2L08_08065 [Palleronia sediminis]
MTPRPILALAALGLSVLATPSATMAATPMTAAEFEAYVTGKTLTFSVGGSPYGQEEYRDGRRVRWSFLDGDCKEGDWFPQGDHICFAYDDDPPGAAPICWTFYSGPAGLRAELADDPAGSVFYETRQSDEPLVCLGPEVGV